ncbi:MAG: hypothetical protein ACRDOL_38155, partial [Streptosporangiaceae bacterium]
MADSSSVPEAVLDVTWAPEASSSSARLLRNSPESSAIASRMGSLPQPGCLSWRAVDADLAVQRAN